MHYRQQTEIKRTETIYTPLYDQLNKNISYRVSSSIDYVYPPPRFINLSAERSKGIGVFLQYNEWGSIELDARHIETPQSLVNEMNILIETIKEYMSIYQSANKSLHKSLEAIFADEINAASTAKVQNTTCIEYILKSTEDSLNTLFRHYGYNQTLDTEAKERIVERINNETDSSLLFQSIFIQGDKWIKQERKVVLLLSKRIKRAKKP